MSVLKSQVQTLLSMIGFEYFGLEVPIQVQIALIIYSIFRLVPPLCVKTICESRMKPLPRKQANLLELHTAESGLVSKYQGCLDLSES